MYTDSATDENYPRQVFLLTDGEVQDTQEVLEFVKTKVGINSRIFTFGIGAEASKALVRGIAKYGRGKVSPLYFWNSLLSHTYRKNSSFLAREWKEKLLDSLNMLFNQCSRMFL